MRWLAFGLSGQIGDALREQLRPGDPHLVAYSRAPRAPGPGIEWRQGDLGAGTAPEAPFEAVISLGPLDCFAQWLAASPLAPARVVALGSTSAASKQASPDAAERALADRLLHAEQTLADTVHARGGSLCLLRPTLVYGRGRDRSLTRLVALARRWCILPLPADARGLRQPVHADDVAGAVLACLRAVEPVRGSFDLPGGERLAYIEMVRRALAAGAPGSRVLALPDPLFRTALRGLHAMGLLAGAGEGVLSRLGRDLVADASAAHAAFGYSPRAFAPQAEMFRSYVASQHEMV